MPPLEILIPSFVILIVSLSVHEAAHAWTADRLGDPTARQLGRLTINPLVHIDVIGTVVFPLVAMSTGLPLLGWAKPVPVNWNNLRAPRRDFALVAVAGPVSNLLMATAGALLLTVVPGGATALSGHASVGGVLVTAVIINVLLAVFNLIPVPPLDGGNVLAGLVPESVARVIDRVRGPMGIVLLYVLIFAGVLDRFVWPIAQGILRWLL